MSTGPSGNINVATIDNNPEMLAQPPADRLAQGSSPEKQSEAKTQGCSVAAFCLEEKRKEQQVARARRDIECANRKEQVEAPAVLSVVLSFHLDRSNDGFGVEAGAPHFSGVDRLGLGRRHAVPKAFLGFSESYASATSPMGVEHALRSSPGIIKRRDIDLLPPVDE
jgi:hypothetical protein